MLIIVSISTLVKLGVNLDLLISLVVLFTVYFSKVEVSSLTKNIYYCDWKTFSVDRCLRVKWIEQKVGK